MMKLIKTTLFVSAFISFGIFVFQINTPTVLAQGGGMSRGVPVIDLIDNKTNKIIHTSTSSGSASINVKDVQNYSLKMSVMPFDVANYKRQMWKGEVIFNGSQKTALFPRPGPLQSSWERITTNGVKTQPHQFSAGSAVAGTYQYVVTFSQDENGQCGGASPAYCQGKLTIIFKNSGTTTTVAGTGANPNANNNSTTTPTDPNNPNNTNTPAGTKPNTGISAKFGDPDQELGRFWNPLTFETVPELISNIIRILFVLVGLAAVIVIIIAGFRMVLDSGNEEQLKKAKQAITWAIVGLIVSILAFSIVAIVQRVIQS